jgi:hypothetical protein
MLTEGILYYTVGWDSNADICLFFKMNNFNLTFP